jgi:tripartite-type tricarboxylate transporter receptor subunit TctC
MKKTLAALGALAASFLCIAPAPSWAQGAASFPAKPIRLVVPYPAGGTTDIMARSIQAQLQEKIGQTVIVDNKPGASGVLAAREVAHAPADGYTLLFVNSGMVSVTPLVVPNAGFDGVKDFAPVALVSTAPLFVVTNAKVPATDLRSFIAYAKKQPQPLAYASAGVGSFGHLASELFAKTAGLKMTHIPYKGQAPTTNAVISGEVQVLITTASATMNEFIENGRLRLLGVTSGEPSSLAPNAPTVGTVLAGYKAETWFAVLAPANTPGTVVAKLNKAISESVRAEGIDKRFASFGLVAATATPEKLAEMVRDDVARWAPVVRENNISSN